LKGADLALVLTGVVLNAVAQLLLKAGARALSGVPLQLGNWGVLLERAVINPPILAGLGCYVISVAVWILALTRVDVSVAYPMLSIGYVLNAVAAAALFAEQLSVQRMAGIGVIVVGCWLVARS
jgi:multidrug transporter EmrE-like cation transporter